MQIYYTLLLFLRFVSGSRVFVLYGRQACFFCFCPGVPTRLQSRAESVARSNSFLCTVHVLRESIDVVNLNTTASSVGSQRSVVDRGTGQFKTCASLYSGVRNSNHRGHVDRK